MPAEITVYTSPACQQCKAVKRRLKAAGVTPIEHDVTVGTVNRDFLKSIGYESVPVTMTSWGDEFQGYDPGRIDAAIARYLEETTP